VLDDPDQRLRYYRDIIDREAARLFPCKVGGCR